MKKLLIGLLFLFAAGCAQEHTGDTLVVAHKGEMESLDPV